jgi:hypothetical protein
MPATDGELARPRDPSRGGPPTRLALPHTKWRLLRRGRTGERSLLTWLRGSVGLP